MERVDPRLHSSHSSVGRGFPQPSGKKFEKIIGPALIAIGVIFSLYAAGSGVSTLIRASLDHFGLVFLAGTINFIFWTIVVFPIGGVISNTLCALGGVLIFGGLPAIPGLAIAAVGLYLHLK
jgi:hypothetical protein